MASQKYDLDFEEPEKIKGGFIKKFLLYPEFWDKPSNQIAINLNWKKYKFTRANQKHVVKQRGIYCFVVQPNVRQFFETKYLFYIGKTNGTLHSRYGNYLDEQEGKRKSRPKVYNMLKKYEGHLYYYFTPLATAKQVNDVEDKLINTFFPHVNVQVQLARIKPEFQYLYE